MPGNTDEKTYIMVKPDGVHRGLVSKVIKKFEQRGFQIVAMKMMMPTTEILQEHYKDLKDKPFFNGLVAYMAKGPVVCLVFQGLDVVKQGRVMLGETNPLSSNPGSLRGDYCIQVGRNCFHGSDSVESANREIALWFKKEELACWTPHTKSMIYE